MVKENSNEMISPDDERHSSPSNLSGNSATSLLAKIQHQLSRLERKMDNIISILQERHFSGNSSVERSFQKKPPLKASRASGRFDNREFKKRNEKSGEESTDQKFYSRFTKQSGHSRHRKNTFHRKPQKRK